MSRGRSHLALLAGLGLSGAIGAGARAVDVPDYGFDWVTIGDPGNPPFLEPLDLTWPLFYVRPLGRVDYVYRMTRTEITVEQWYEFVLAYRTYWDDGNVPGFDFTGLWISPIGFDDDGVWEYSMPDLARNFPTTGGAIYAAMYCNWLHNNKSPEFWAFRDGVYDISVLERIDEEGDQGTGHLEFARRPGALFWITDLDEWMKGMYWDPDKHGPGQGGYWWYPISSDEVPVGGVDTNAGRFWYDGDEPLELFNVGSFPHAMSPWGLLDGSGGEPEWQEYEYGSWFQDARDVAWRGDWAFGSNPARFGAVAFLTGTDIRLADHGIRLASVQPCAPDLAVPYGILDLADVVAFAVAYTAGDPAADLAEPFGTIDPGDATRFVEAFGQRCGWFDR